MPTRATVQSSLGVDNNDGASVEEICGLIRVTVQR